MTPPIEEQRMPATLTQPYRRNTADARRIAEAFRAATRGIDGKLLRERLSELSSRTLPETPEGRHTGAYFLALTEVASKVPDENRDDARAFVTAFANRPAAYSRTNAGLAAVQLEAWLIEVGGALYSRFIETVLDGGGSKFLAIFEGPIDERDREKMRLGTGSFVKMEPIAEAGAIDYDGGDLLECTFFDCTPVGKQEKDLLPKNATEPADPTTTADQTPKFESLIPKSRSDYDRVFEQEGVTRAVAMYLFGAGRVRGASVVEGQITFIDPNGVRWFSENGDVWLPDVDALDSDSISEGDAVTESETASESQRAPLHETNDRNGAVRSLCNTWAVFTNPVLVEGSAVPATIVTARERAWVLAQPIEEARRIIDEAAALYVDSPVEGDLFIEAALAEFAEDHGEPCVNESEVLQLVVDVPDRPTRADRDYDVRVITTQRMSESLGHGGYDAQALCALLESAMQRKAPGKAAWAFFDNRFGAGGQVYIKFYNAARDASDVDKLNSSPNFTLSISPFDSDGRAAAPKLKAVMLTGYPRSLPWRGKTAPPDVLARYIEAFIEKLDLGGVSEADGEDDASEPEEGKPRNPS